MTLTHAETVALIRRANKAGFDSVGEYCLVLEAALRAIAIATDAGPWDKVARLALIGRFHNIDARDELGGPGA